MQAIDAGCATLFADNDRLHTAGRLAAETKSEGMETDQVNREPPPAVAAEADYMDAEEDNLYTDNVAPKAATSNVRATAQQHALIALEYDTCLAYIAKDGSFTVRPVLLYSFTSADRVYRSQPSRLCRRSIHKKTSSTYGRACPIGQSSKLWSWKASSPQWSRSSWRMLGQSPRRCSAS